MSTVYQHVPSRSFHSVQNAGFKIIVGFLGISVCRWITINNLQSLPSLMHFFLLKVFFSTMNKVNQWNLRSFRENLLKKDESRGKNYSLGRILNHLADCQLDKGKLTTVANFEKLSSRYFESFSATCKITFSVRETTKY